jgi:hypothetical protein
MKNGQNVVGDMFISAVTGLLRPTGAGFGFPVFGKGKAIMGKDGLADIGGEDRI